MNKQNWQYSYDMELCNSVEDVLLMDIDKDEGFMCIKHVDSEREDRYLEKDEYGFPVVKYDDKCTVSDPWFVMSGNTPVILDKTTIADESRSAGGSSDFAFDSSTYIPEHHFAFDSSVHIPEHSYTWRENKEIETRANIYPTNGLYEQLAYFKKEREERHEVILTYFINCKRMKQLNKAYNRLCKLYVESCQKCYKNKCYSNVYLTSRQFKIVKKYVSIRRVILSIQKLY